MHGYIPRHLFNDIKKDLALFPAVVISGPRQCGKSVLARKILDTIPGSIWLDLENPRDRARLTDPLLFLAIHADHLVCIDEIQLMPELFPLLRTEIDRVRSPGRFLLLSLRFSSVNKQNHGKISYHGCPPSGSTVKCCQAWRVLDLSGPAIRARLDFLVEALFFRLLPPWEGNLKKRLVKSPKLYKRDTGLTHTLLNIESLDDLMAHPVWGASWEAYCIESICSTMVHWQASFYRTSSGAELDLVLEKGQRRLCFEFKASSAPTPGKGFYSAVEDLEPEHCYIVGFVEQPYPLAKHITVCNLLDCLERCNE